MSDAPVSQFDKALAHLEELMLEGLRHGFFSCTVNIGLSAETGRRHLVIRAGKSHKYVIAEAELS
jgi:hypothetical protein